MTKRTPMSPEKCPIMTRFYFGCVFESSKIKLSYFTKSRKFYKWHYKIIVYHQLFTHTVIILLWSINFWFWLKYKSPYFRISILKSNIDWKFLLNESFLFQVSQKQILYYVWNVSIPITLHYYCSFIEMVKYLE